MAIDSKLPDVASSGERGEVRRPASTWCDRGSARCDRGSRLLGIIDRVFCRLELLGEFERRPVFLYRGNDLVIRPLEALDDAGMRSVSHGPSGLSISSPQG
jgi:hypothetical protein